MSDVFERMWWEAVVTKFEALTRHLRGGTGRTAKYVGQDWTGEPREYKSFALVLSSLVFKAEFETSITRPRVRFFVTQRQTSNTFCN